MMHYLPTTGCAAAAALILAATSAVGARAQTTACIDTNAVGSLVRRTMTIEQQGRPQIAVSGAIVSLDPATGEVGVTAFGVDGQQRIRPTVIRLETSPPSMAAQMSLPSMTPLGPISIEFPYSELKVDHGVLHYPQCTSPAAPGHIIVFTGTLSFSDGKLRVDGDFSDYAIPGGAGARPGLLGQKPG